MTVRNHLLPMYTCAAAEIASDNGREPPEGCAIRVSRRVARWLNGEPWCCRCLLRELREDLVLQSRRRAELRKRPSLTERETAELRALDAASERRREHRLTYAKKYRHGELRWQQQSGAAA